MSMVATRISGYSAFSSVFSNWLSRSIFICFFETVPSSLISNAMTRRTLVLFTMDICVSPLFCLLSYSQNGRPRGPSLPVAVECFSRTSPAQAQESRVRIVNGLGSRPIRRYRLRCRRFAPVIAAEFAQCNHEGAKPFIVDGPQFPAGLEERPGHSGDQHPKTDLEEAESVQRDRTNDVFQNDPR